MIFSRKRGDETRETAGRAGKPAATDAAGADVEIDEETGAADIAGVPGRDASTGPFDITEAPSVDKFLDLGALHIPMVDGVEVRVQADPSGRVQQVALVAGENGLQLAVMAAPRTEPMWDEVRSEIRAQLRSDGFASQEAPGPYGVELRTRVRTPEGQTDLRFIGVSGPRWLVRAILQGPVALDESLAPGLLTCLRGLVIDRGHEAMPAGDLLPLRLPKEIAEQAAGAPQPDAAADAKQADEQRAAKARQRRQNAKKR